jgi:hypothetical protein
MRMTSSRPSSSRWSFVRPAGRDSHRGRKTIPMEVFFEKDFDQQVNDQYIRPVLIAFSAQDEASEPADNGPLPHGIHVLDPAHLPSRPG